jgi:hypothetical protein
VVRRIFGHKKELITGHWRKLYTEELHDLYSPLNVIWVIKTRRIKWAGHVTHMQKKNV